MVVEGLVCLGNEGVALVCRLQEGDAVLYAEGDVAARVGHGGKGKVGEGEIGSTLADVGTIEVSLLYLHLGACIAFAYLGELHPVCCGKAVALVEEIL